MLSVIIPTRNSAEVLPDILASITASAIDDIIVSDGGSDDATLNIAIATGARIALGRGGRGWQLARGARMALAQEAQDWLLFLHADSQLGEGWHKAVTDHMQSRPDAAGYFRFALNDSGFWPSFMERGVALRCAALGLPYGDQALLIRRDHYERCGGYPNWVLFEDVKIARAIGRKGLCALPARLTTDASKYIRDGYGRRIRANLTLLARYFLGEKPDDLANRYKVK